MCIAMIARGMGSIRMLKDAFEEWDTIKSQRTVGLIFTAMDVFLGGVGIVTLALGAVGIINIMLVTVTERTQEIGLRKALGATNRSILTQFFLEGLMLTGLSGVIGIVGAGALMLALGQAMGNNQMGFDPPRLVPWSAAMAMGTLMLCGIVAGTLSGEQGGDAGAGRSAAEGVGRCCETSSDRRWRRCGTIGRRTAITMVGMAWGIATVVLLLAYGAGFGRAFETIFAQLGTNMIGVFPGTHQRAGRRRRRPA